MIDLSLATNDILRRCHRFTHNAMATVFEIFIIHKDKVYAEEAAFEAFRYLDQLEQELSRFLTNSDISRINHSGAGQPIRVGSDTFACLKQCVDLTAKTKGVFDITIGAFVQIVNQNQKSRKISKRKSSRHRP